MIDRALTGLACLFVGTVGVGILHSAFLDLDWEERPVPAGPDRRHLLVQGNFIGLPAGSDRLRLPTVLADGTLDVAREHSLGEPESDVRLPRAADFFDEARQGMVRSHFADSRRLRGRWWYSQPYRGSPWIFAADRGILKLDSEGRLAGSLTDGGWVPGRIAPSSFARALNWTWPDANPWASAVEEKECAVVAYVTPDGAYVADLDRRAIDRIADVDGRAVWLWNGRNLSPARHWLLAEDRAIWVSAEEGSRRGTLELPPSIRRREGREVAFGDSGRLIFRLPRGPLEYHVAVLDASGRVEREYDYAFRPAGATEVIAKRDAYPPGWSRGPTPDSKLGGVLAALIASPAWHATGLAWPALPVDVRRRLGAEVWLGLPGLGILTSLTLAGIVFLRTRPHGAIGVALGWSAFTAIFGLAGLLTWAFLGGRGALESCARCGRRRSVGAPSCPRCGGESAGPRRLKVDILDPVRAG